MYRNQNLSGVAIKGFRKQGGFAIRSRGQGGTSSSLDPELRTPAPGYDFPDSSKPLLFDFRTDIHRETGSKNCQIIFTASTTVAERKDGSFVEGVKLRRDVGGKEHICIISAVALEQAATYSPGLS